MRCRGAEVQRCRDAELLSGCRRGGGAEVVQRWVEVQVAAGACRGAEWVLSAERFSSSGDCAGAEEEWRSGGRVEEWRSGGAEEQRNRGEEQRSRGAEEQRRRRGA